MHSKKHYNEALLALIGQGIGVFLLFPVSWVWWGLESSVSVLVGGAVCLLSNLIFYHFVFVHRGARQRDKIIKGLVWGECCKILSIVTLLCAGFMVSWFHPVGLLMGFIVSQTLLWVLPLLVISRLRMVGMS